MLPLTPSESWPRFVAPLIVSLLWVISGSFAPIAAQPAVPTLLTPLSGATEVPNTVDLRWTASTGATRYNVQVATDSEFNDKILKENVPGTQITFSAPSQGTTYFWRVNAAGPGGASAFSTESSFTTIQLIPPAPVLLTPLNGAVDVPNTVDLRWAFSANATRYNVEVATDSEVKNKILQVNVPGPQVTFDAPTQGTKYFWRVNAVGPGGRSPYSMTFHFTTILLKPGRPQLIAPADGAVDQPNQLTLRWSSVVNASRYDVQVFSDSMMQNEVFHLNTPGTMAEFTAPNAGSMYFWRVQAFGPGGATASILGRFMTSGTAGSLVPSNLIPEDGATGVPIDPLLSWSPPQPDSSQYYRLQVATNETFDSLVVDVDSIDATSYQVTGLEYETMYCWRVGGVDRSGNVTFSPAQSFTTIGMPPGIVQLVSPADKATGVSALVQLTWEALEGAAQYEVQVATDEDFTGLFVTDSIAGTTFDAPEPYAYNTTYYWRVRAGNENGFGDYSEVRSFTTATGVSNANDELPSKLALAQNYPNPFNPSTRIEYALPKAADVRIAVFDALGRPVATLVDGQMPAGNHAVVWDGRDLVSGTYFYRMEAGEFVSTKRMTLLK